MNIFGIAAQDVVGIVFLAGVIAFALGASTPNYTGLDSRVYGTSSTQEYLEFIAPHHRAWRWSSLWIGIGTLFNLVGFGLLAVLLRNAGDQLLSEAGLLIFMSGVIFLFTTVAFRIGVETVAAKTLEETAAVPVWFEAMQAWNTTLGLSYMVLGYLATAIFGWALLETAVLPAWIGWLAIALGITGAPSILTNSPLYPGSKYSIAAVPAWLHIIPLIIGIALLVQG